MKFAVCMAEYERLAAALGEQWAKDNLILNEPLDYLRECNYSKPTNQQTGD